MPVIETHHLSKSYGARRGATDVSLSVGAGDIFGFLGPNGAGKSTTIRLLMGFLQASTGSASILQQDCWKASAAIKKDVGYVAGDVRLYPWLTIRKSLQIVSEIRREDLMKPGMELAERFQLEMDVPVRKMSRGNRQKVALVTALAHRPQVVILDEPTSGLDPLIQETLASCLKELAVAGHTVFFSSHTLSEVEALCTRVAIVKDGQIVADDQLAAMKAQAPRTVTLSFPAEHNLESITIPDGATVQSRDNNQLTLQVVGAAVEVTRWASTLPITDIAVGQPNLESLFREYYQTTTTEPDVRPLSPVELS